MIFPSGNFWRGVSQLENSPKHFYLGGNSCPTNEREEKKTSQLRSAVAVNDPADRGPAKQPCMQLGALREKKVPPKCPAIPGASLCPELPFSEPKKKGASQAAGGLRTTASDILYT